MTPQRRRELECGPDPQTLTQDERKQGWHFCFDFEGMLVNRFDTEGEATCCTCYDDAKDKIP
jgi:hypothetical protein